MQTVIRGIGAAPGVAVGPVWVFGHAAVKPSARVSDGRDVEWARVDAAIAQTRAQLVELHARAVAKVGEEQAAIFEAHQMFLDDEEFVGAIKAGVEDALLPAETAIEQAMSHYADVLLALDDEYFKARATDVRDVGQRLIRNATGAADDASTLSQPSIIVAYDLTPSDTIQFEREFVLGLCTVKGGPTSHVAILSRSLGVPAVVSAPLPPIDSIEVGSLAVLDGESGVVTLSPDNDAVLDGQRRRNAWLSARASAQVTAHQPAVTTDGHHVEIVANIGGLRDAIAAVDNGAEGVGLFRTEFLFMDRDTLPTEDEQVDAYRDIARVMGGRPLVVRMLDVGGDKAVPYLDIEQEENPFLGWRAIRMIDGRADVYLTQFRALLRAFADEDGMAHDLRIMLPMVCNMMEIERGRALLEQAQEELRGERSPHAQRVQFGIMIEVPSAALLASHFAQAVDFFSIGTNDLTQYTLAVDRGNARVAKLASPFNPAVLRLISMSIDAAHRYGKWCGICGELGGDALAAPVLLGMGMDEFSMSPSSIPAHKQAIRALSRGDCEAIAQHALSLPTTRAVTDYLSSLK